MIDRRITRRSRTGLSICHTWDHGSALYRVWLVYAALYDLVGNYVLLSSSLRCLSAVMFPMGLNQQKNTFKQQALQGEIAEIRRLYPDDKKCRVSCRWNFTKSMARRRWLAVFPRFSS